jgi:hypothetical protein
VAATIQVSVSFGAGPTVTDGVAGVDLESADNATNSLANRQANPITVGTSSYEKWIRLKVATAPANGVTNFQAWGPGAAQLSTTLWMTAAYVTYQQGTTAASTIANTSMANFTSGNKVTWDAASYSATGSYTKHLVLQLQVGSDCGPGSWTTETISYAFSET